MDFSSNYYLCKSKYRKLDLFEISALDLGEEVKAEIEDLEEKEKNIVN